jgi:Lrp/AsnC family leucine-responsive transcriptional regulator
VRVACQNADDLDATVRAIRGEGGAAQTETRIVLRTAPVSQRVG